MTSMFNPVSVGYLIYGFTPKVSNEPISTFSNLITHLSGMPNTISSRQEDSDVFRKHPAVDIRGIEYFQGPMSFIQPTSRNGSYFIGVTASEVYTDGTSPILLDLKFKALQGVEHGVTVDNYLSKHGLAVKSEDIGWHFIVTNKTNIVK